MPDESSSAVPEKLKQWADDLACPVCFASLRFTEAAVICTGCGRIYPVVDGIPVLIPQRARLETS